MRIALPVADDVLCAHFGHCTHFALFDVDAESRTVTGHETVPAPAHEPGKFPVWLHEQGATVILAAGMGSRARELFAANGISVVIGATESDPEAAVNSYLAGRLAVEPNFCDK
jgi:predicted Fe-Mo cluster-binding NifX family protein